MHIYKSLNDIAGDNNYSTILVVGHNPGLEELIEGLTGNLQQLSTCALAIIEIPIEKWSFIKEKQGQD